MAAKTVKNISGGFWHCSLGSLNRITNVIFHMFNRWRKLHSSKFKFHLFNQSFQVSAEFCPYGQIFYFLTSELPSELAIYSNEFLGTLNRGFDGIPWHSMLAIPNSHACFSSSDRFVYVIFLNSCMKYLCSIISSQSATLSMPIVHVHCPCPFDHIHVCMSISISMGLCMFMPCACVCPCPCCFDVHVSMCPWVHGCMCKCVHVSVSVSVSL
jgi:hypothetical protein